MVAPSKPPPPVAPSHPDPQSESSSSAEELRESSSSSSSSQSEPQRAITPTLRPQPPIRQHAAEEREQERRETDIRMQAVYEQALRFSVEGSEDLYNKGCELPVQSLLGDDDNEDTVEEQHDEELEEDIPSLAKGKRSRASPDDENLDPILQNLDPFADLRPRNEEEERRTLKRLRQESRLTPDTVGDTSSSAQLIEPAHHTSPPPTAPPHDAAADPSA
ncbi:uncharacterized protein LOC132644409 [Lycium barbarum]|uniref:uncharacterized protein LOC132644409 n=1 Tax=Lycium barbarum TaxID=112863 RepID=UPI00293ED120|nr:uncharacterized protein LOC132644409 [Lycium barbarum]